jgi:GNAT superfamily N-acetyltransferase
MTQPAALEHTRPALYMVWDPCVTPVALSVAPAYYVAAVSAEDVSAMRAAVEMDGVLTDAQWNSFVERILPDGLFAARLADSDEVVGTASAVNNPRGGRYYFPGGGQIGYLVVAAEHRGHGVGHALVAAALGRLRAAGYCTIWLGVQEWRLPAIVTYLKNGFVPFLHDPDPDALASRWRVVFQNVGRTAEVGSWRRDLPGP